MGDKKQEEKESPYTGPERRCGPRIDARTGEKSLMVGSARPLPHTITDGSKEAAMFDPQFGGGIVLSLEQEITIDDMVQQMRQALIDGRLF